MSAEDYIEGFVCTLQTCSVKDWGYVHYQPSIAGNALFAGLLGLLAIAQFFLWRKCRTGGTAIAMLIGLVTEILGYIARILLHGNPFGRDYFLWYLITLTIGPVFFAAAIYLTLGRIVVVYGVECSRLRPGTYTLIFLGCDILSLVVQAVGGGIAASYPVTMQNMVGYLPRDVVEVNVLGWEHFNRRQQIDLGTNILVAGLSIQVASLFFFAACSVEFLLRAKRHREKRNPEFATLVASKKFKIFLYCTSYPLSLNPSLPLTPLTALFLATALLFIRTVFRAIELSEGFAGELANNEVQFMVLDGVMVILACTCLSACHPGWGFQGRWDEAGFHFHPQSKKDANVAGDAENGSAGSVQGGDESEKGVVGVRETRTEGL